MKKLLGAWLAAVVVGGYSQDVRCQTGPAAADAAAMEVVAARAETAPATLPATTAAAAATRLAVDRPTIEQLVQLLDDGKASEVLQNVTRISANRRLAETYDKCDLLVLRGEALLQLKMWTESAAAFSQGAKEARDADRGAFATASALLVTRAKGGVFTPRSKAPADAQGGAAAKGAGTGGGGGGGGGGGAIDLRDRTQRRAAFAALLNDEVEAAKPTVVAALKATSLPPIAKAIDPVLNLGPLERAATGKDEQTQASLQKLVERIQAVIGDHLTKLAGDVAQIQRRANETLQTMITDSDPLNPRSIRTYPVYRKRGVEGADTAALKNVMATCDQIDAAVRELAKRMDAPETQFKDVQTKTKELADKARDVLTTDYSGMVPVTTR